MATNKVKIPRTPNQNPPPQKEEPSSLLVPIGESPMVTAKKIILSKTIWVNLIMLLSFLAQRRWGFIIPEDMQLELLSVINIFLRFVTKEPIAWGGSKTTEENSNNGTNQETP